ncbi:hypothetical protein D3C80_405100 [compost metagenome]
MLNRHVALGNGKQARKTSFRCQKIVAALVQFVFLHAETDRQKTTFFPFKETELHVKGQLARTGCKITQALTQFVGVVLAHRIVGVGLAGFNENISPLTRFSTCRCFDLAVEFFHQAHNIGRKERQIDSAERCRFRLFLDGTHCTTEIGDPLFQTTAQWTQDTTIIRDTSYRFLKYVVDVKNTVEIGLEINRWCFRPFFQRRRKRHKMAREIATIHGRDIKRTHRRQRIGLIPVVEMALIFLHLLKRIDGGFNAIKRLGKADPAKVTRRNHRQKINADIGW